ncbi:flavin-containing monooxygenase [Nocardia xishanensis]|uniref:Flavin-containing monooxygenase n=1 Tax=Nocardia xishanensis TaxID=238964 RepID=A0ABW7XBP4_9NOCA
MVNINTQSLGKAEEELDVLIVGGGFAGLYQLHRLRELGFNVRVFEAAPGLGGVWYWNCYPGARTDSAGIAYQFSDEKLWKDWDFSEAYPSGPEMRAYFEHVDQKLDLSRDIQFNTTVRSAEFDEDRRQWEVRTEDGAITRARFLVLCTGIGAKPHLPHIEGLEDFRGKYHHTAAWPQEGVDLTDKRVGVIGTGASGVQMAQSSAAVAAQLTVFQRTPNLALPMQQRVLDDAGKQAIKDTAADVYAMRAQTFGGTEYDFLGLASLEKTPEELREIYEKQWGLGGLRIWVGGFLDVLQDPKANRVMYDFWRDKVHARINDPAVAEKLAPAEPPHPFGAKRPSLEQNYFDVFNQDNVRLVDLREAPIQRATAKGLRTADGEEHELDVLVLATGFDAITGGLTAIDIRGTGGSLLREKWENGVEAHLGCATQGFPNMVFLGGPLSPAAFCNGPSCAELQGEEIVQMIAYLREKGITRFESTSQADSEWRALVDQIANTTLFPLADSWYMGANVPGKARQLLSFPGGVPVYLQQWSDQKAAGYSAFELS